MPEPVYRDLVVGYMDTVDRESRKAEERRPVEEAGGGEAEGFEQAEEALREAAQHGDERNPEADAYEVEPEAARAEDVSGEADHVKSSERDEGDGDSGEGP